MMTLTTRGPAAGTRILAGQVAGHLGHAFSAGYNRYVGRPRGWVPLRQPTVASSSRAVPQI